MLSLVSALTNFALNKPASQISDYDPGTKWIAAKGNDGNPDTNQINEFCFHTKLHPSPWWEVDLLDVYCISQVNLTNRADCCGM